MRVAVLGGSAVATVQFGEAIADWPEGSARRPPLDFALHGRDAGKLAAVACRFEAAAASAVPTPTARVSHSTALEEVLDNTDVILLQIRVGGLRARSFDESFPWQAGLPGEETLGPGGLANALRTVREVSRIWPIIKRVCPQALVVVLTNPAGVVAQAAAAEGLRAVEVCDSPVAFVGAIAERLGVNAADVARRYVGMNHVGWYVPETRAQLESLRSGQDVAAEVVQAHQAVPLGYVRYYVEPDRIYAAQRGEPTRAEKLMEVESAALERLARGASPEAQARPAPWYRLAVVPLLDRLANGSAAPLILGCANEGRLPTLASDSIVEGLVSMSPSGTVQRHDLVKLPPVPAAMLSRHAAYEQLAIDAALAPSWDSIFAALLANPMVATAHQAEILANVLSASAEQDYETALPGRRSWRAQSESAG